MSDVLGFGTSRFEPESGAAQSHPTSPPMTTQPPTDAQLAAELTAAEADFTQNGNDPDGERAERMILAQSAICERLDLSLDETERGLTQWASDRIDAFVKANT